MNKNTNPMNDIINDFTEKFGDNKVQMTFRDVKEGMAFLATMKGSKPAKQLTTTHQEVMENE